MLHFSRFSAGFHKLNTEPHPLSWGPLTFTHALLHGWVYLLSWRRAAGVRDRCHLTIPHTFECSKHLPSKKNKGGKKKNHRTSANEIGVQCHMGLSPVMSGDGSSPVSRELWKTMLMVRSTNTRRMRAPMLRREGKNSLRRAHQDLPAPGWKLGDLKRQCMP